jgi:hypothetical protein
LPAAAQVPALSRTEGLSGSTDPNRRVRDGVRRAIDRRLHPNDP